jgi:hypothetical protein
MPTDIIPNRLSVIYDGDCPFCANFVKLYAIRKNAGDMELINARERPLLVQELRAQGMEINDGMVVIWREHHYFGVEGMHLLSILGTESGIFGMLNRFLFRNRNAAAAIYPVLAIGRRTALFLLRRKLIPY